MRLTWSGCASSSSPRKPLVPAYTDILACLVAFVLKCHRRIAVRWDHEHQSLIPVAGDRFNIGIAVDTPDGLIVSVVRDLAHKSLLTVAQESKTLMVRSRSGHLTAAEMQGGVVTITNLGAYGMAPGMGWESAGGGVGDPSRRTGDGVQYQGGERPLLRVGQPRLLVHNASILPEGMVRTSSESDKEHFRAEDGDDSTFFIEGNLTAGRLSFTVVAEKNGQHGQFSGRAFFNAMIDHFGKRRVKVIAAQWTDADEDLKTNLDIFNKETKSNWASERDEKREEAAFKTHTGRWAKDIGFKLAQDIDVTPDGLPGGYEQVTVDFVRPPRKKR